MDVFAFEWVPAIGLAVALSATAGIRAWLPLLLAGLAMRAGWLEVGPSFAFLASTKALVVFAVATLLEVVADKVPAVDHALDALGTPLKLGAGALLAAAAFGTVTDPLTSAALGVAVGAPTALVPHAAKSLLRATSTALTGGLANPVISLLEDVAAFAFFILAVLVPLVVAGLVLLVILLALRRRTAPAPHAPHPA
ncbi:MAG TPA: DUF4126 domain-containing protein [Vicinamibacteria bacterium]